MNLSTVKENQWTEKASPGFYRELKIFSAPSGDGDLCYNLDKKLFQLEKDLAYFNFAVKEIKDITKTS